MPYQVTCETDNYNKTFDDCADALIAYNSHNRKGHKVSMVAVGDSSQDSLSECLESKGVFNNAFRISQNPFGLSYSFPNGGSAKAHRAILEDDTNPPVKPPKNSRYNFYFERLVKLIPSEIIGLYLALYALAVTDSGVNQERAGWIAVICFLLVFISRLFGTKITGYNSLSYFKTAQWKSIVISAISFFIWVYAMGHTFPFIEKVEQFYVQAAVILWTFIIPIFYKGEE